MCCVILKTEFVLQAIIIRVSQKGSYSELTKMAIVILSDTNQRILT